MIFYSKAMMELLGLRTEIKTYIGDDQYISSSCVNDRLDDGTIDVVPSNEVRQTLTSYFNYSYYDLDRPI